MLNLSQLTRTSTEAPLKDRVMEFVEPELYIVEDIADYKRNKSLIVPPWFKKNPFFAANYYALIVFYNIGIKGVSEEGELTENLVEVHDESSSAVMCWTKPGEIFPAGKSYFQMLDNCELQLQDWVYMLIIKHSYEEELPFVSEVTKRRVLTMRREKDSLFNRVTSLFPDFEPVPQPSY